MVNLPPPESDDRPSVPPARDNDEAIAVAIAFLSVGAILWWGWTRGQAIFAPEMNLSNQSESVLESGLSMTAEDAESGAIAAPATRNQNRFFSVLGNDDDSRVEADEAARSPGLTSELDRDLETGDRSMAGLPAAAAVTGSDSVLETDASGMIEEDRDLATDDGSDTAAEATNGAAATDDAEAGGESLPALDISDVSPDYWAYPYIVSLYEADLLPNLTTSELQPDKELTRAEMAALLSSSFVGDETPQRSLNFTDITSDYWAAGAVKQVVDAGYMTGFPDETFKPNELIPRYQVLVTLASGLELAPPTNVDEILSQFQGTQDLPDWARSQVAAAAAAGLIVNHPDPQQLEPQQPATRAELIAIIHRALAADGRIEPVDTPFAAPAP